MLKQLAKRTLKTRPFLNQRPILTTLGVRRFAAPPAQEKPQEDDLLYQDLEQKARDIDLSIKKAKENIEMHQRRGLKMVEGVASQLEEDKYVKMQRYDIFITKMEQLARAEKRWKKEERTAKFRMQSAFMTSSAPLREILYHYNQASEKGFNASLMATTLEQIKMALRGKGTFGRSYDDYTLREFDISWRMQVLGGHIKTALSDKLYFNHYFLGQASRQLGEIGYKDVEIIQKGMEKLELMLKERDNGKKFFREPLTFHEAVYGTYLNFVPRHYVYDGFESNSEFEEHLHTLLQWEAEEADVFANMGVQADESIKDLEQSMGSLIKAASNLKDLQVDMQGNLENLRHQYFKLQAASNKHEFLEENKYIRLELLELQEKLVVAGYLEPEEALNFVENQSFKDRMDRASHVFYDYIQNYAPELISPSHVPFIDAAETASSLRENKKQKFDLSEDHDKISLSSLSQTLVGLEKQALSFRRDTNDKDYLHDFYKQHCAGKDFKTFEEVDETHPSNLDDMPYVRMAREYLRAWKVYDDGIQKLEPRILKLVSESLGNSEDILFGFRGLSAAKLEAPEAREKMFESYLKMAEDGSVGQPRVQALIDGLYGIALQAQQSEQSTAVAKHALSLLKNTSADQLDFDQKNELLWAISALGLEQDTHLTEQIFNSLNVLDWQNTANDMNYSQYQALRDSMVYLTQVSPVKSEKWVKAVHKNLDFIAKDAEFHHQRFPESAASFDPFKKRVIQGVARGLSLANIDNEIRMEENLLGQTDMSNSFLRDQTPYKSDINFGYKGQKVLLNVVPASQAMRDVGLPNGDYGFKAKMLRQLAQEPIQTVGIPVQSVLNLDIENLKLEMNKQFDFLDTLKKQLDVSSEPSWKHSVEIDGLADFGAAFTKNFQVMLEESEGRLGDKQRYTGVFKQLLTVFQHKHQLSKQYEKILYQQGMDQLKFELMKLQLVFEALPLHQRKQLDALTGSSFSTYIEEAKQQVQIRLNKSTYDSPDADSKINFNWMGTRQEVELPQAGSVQLKKKIEPEMINQKFMWVDDYFHYEDWEAIQKDTYDAFNLLIIPHKEGEVKYFHDRTNFQRIVPQGIFPAPNDKREPLLPQASEYANKLIGSGNDALTAFEEAPYQMMIEKELNRSVDLKKVTKQTSYITNLQNLKQGLKQDYSDHDLLKTLLVNTQFTDALIEDHLKSLNDAKNAEFGSAEFLERDPSKFREFVKSTYFSKDQEDPFSHFFIKESGKIERMHKVHRDAAEKYTAEVDSMDRSVSHKKLQEKIFKTVEEKINDMMLQNERENEDITSISHQFNSEVKVNYDLKSLMKSENVYDIEPELINADLTDPAYLLDFRRRAETKLIKSRILFKKHNEIPLSNSETKYLKKWQKEINSNKGVNLLNVRDTMVPRSHSKKSLKDTLQADDIYTLNQIAGVQFSSDLHGGFALNDLVVEMSHFLDGDLVNRVETEMISDRLRKEWNLPSDFQVLETRNKEIGLVMNELEELAWRMAGQFDEKDMTTLKKMFSVLRNDNHFDSHFYENDMKSMEEFLQNVNTYDHRNKMLEEWVVRKEDEIQSRVMVPPKALQKPDSELFAWYDKDLKKAREQLVSKLLPTDKLGNKMPAKDYNDLTSEELGRISEAISVRLPVFSGKYPAFMPQAVKAVMEHPNLRPSDFTKLDTFSRIFELDWRGDIDFENKQRFLSMNPVYLHHEDRSNFIGYGTIGNYEISAMMRQACTPFVGELAQSLKTE